MLPTFASVAFRIGLVCALVSAVGCATDSAEDPTTFEDDTVGGGKADGNSQPVNIPASRVQCSLADTPNSWVLADPPPAARDHARNWRYNVFPSLPSYQSYYVPALEKVISMTDSDHMVLQLTDVKPPGYFSGQGNYETTRSWVVFVNGTNYQTHEETRFAFPVGSSYMLASPKAAGGTGSYDSPYTLVDKDGRSLAKFKWMSVHTTRVADDAVVLSVTTTLSIASPALYVVRPEGVYPLNGGVAPVCVGAEGEWATP